MSQTLSHLESELQTEKKNKKKKQAVIEIIFKYKLIIAGWSKLLPHTHMDIIWSSALLDYTSK